ncbi:hypothetical protein GOP47_0028090 [Adiantum capillus-veneris]|nr:hypothetical protein GOP47_0028090 [Adiantum capillus-veneris]
MKNPAIISRINVVSVLVAFSLVLWVVCTATRAEARKQLESSAGDCNKGSPDTNAAGDAELHNNLITDVARRSTSITMRRSAGHSRRRSREVVMYDQVDYAAARTHPPTEP